MKKFATVFVVSALLAISSCSFGGNSSTKPTDPVDPGQTVDVTSISLSSSSLTVAVGEAKDLTATVLPTDATNKEVTWSSSDSTVANYVNGKVVGYKAGTASILATSVSNKDVSALCSVTVTNSVVHVNSVSLNKSSAEVNVGGTVSLSATVLPSNATDKTVTWSSSDTTVATVSNGTVTAKAAGSATITVKTNDGNKTATCNITVKDSTPVTGDEWVRVTDTSKLKAGDKYVFVYESAGKVAGNITGSSSTYLSAVNQTVSSGKITSLSSSAVQFTLGGSEDAWTFTSSYGLLTYYYKNDLAWNSQEDSTWSISFSGNNVVIDNEYCELLYNTSSPRFSNYSSSSSQTKNFQLYHLDIPEVPTDPTAISIGSDLEMMNGQTKQLSVEYTPSNANQNLDVTWSSSNSSVVSVSASGLLTASTTAAIGATATITATLKSDSSIKDSLVVTIVETKLDAWTIMIYMCGADLESQNGFATADLTEILSVSGQPDDVNIIVETGGASSWKKYSISSNALTRFEIRNQQITNKKEITKASMGSEETFKSFLNWGLKDYPAEKTAVIFWNHGGAMSGCCFDEKYSNDGLTPSEANNAFASAFSTNKISGKLEWVGYDCCLMQVQDIAELNSHYFNYMIAAEESEAGEGWAYNTWLDDLYAGKDTQTILSACCDGFIQAFEDEYGSQYDNDQTLSWLNLSYMESYKNAWETFAGKLSGKASALRSAAKDKVKNYADTWCDSSLYQQYLSYGYPSSWFTYTQGYYLMHGYYEYGTFDVIDLLNQLHENTSFSTVKTDIEGLLAILSNLIGHNAKGGEAGESNGLCVVLPILTDGTDNYVEYNASDTNFTKWQALVG